MMLRLTTRWQRLNRLRALGLGSDAGGEERDEKHDDTGDLKRNAWAVARERRARPDGPDDPGDTAESLLDAHDLTELFRVATSAQERTRRGKQ